MVLCSFHILKIVGKAPWGRANKVCMHVIRYIEQLSLTRVQTILPLAALPIDISNLFLILGIRFPSKFVSLNCHELFSHLFSVLQY